MGPKPHHKVIYYALYPYILSINFPASYTPSVPPPEPTRYKYPLAGGTVVKPFGAHKLVQSAADFNTAVSVKPVIAASSVPVATVAVYTSMSGSPVVGVSKHCK